MVAKSLRGMRHLTLLVIRLVLGVVLVYHGWTRLKGVDGMAGSIVELRQAGVPAAAVIAWTSLIVELMGGILLIAGALTPIVGGLVVSWMLIQIIWLAGGRGLAATNGGWELPAALGSLALVLLVWGGGRMSLDSMLRPHYVETPLTAPEISSEVEDFPASR